MENLGEDPERKWILGRAGMVVGEDEEGSLKEEARVRKKEETVGFAAAIAEVPGERNSMTPARA